MKEYKFKSKIQEESERNVRIELKRRKKLTEGKKLLKEATLTITTIDDAISAIATCMSLIANKKKSPLTFTDIIASSIISGTDQISQDMITSSSEKANDFANRIKKRIAMIVKDSIGGIKF
jgi:hypothetical protein